MKILFGVSKYHPEVPRDAPSCYRNTPFANMSFVSSQENASFEHQGRPGKGQRLAGLMIQYGVGVRARSTCFINSVDENYFSDA
ncbi:hypothetical protein [Rhodobacter capsulatus]|uniref:hypothetical protein n=1 Tax=Rhodobacter capsulatus TaxID=1061 RepID=UPI0004025F39|nr:hypothetical protein [Rhodobacter capsulatus]